jgi:hypothetical protein
MYEAIGTAGGLGLGGTLGQMLSAPRRGAWSLAAALLGQQAPESGADLLSQTFGMDPDSPWTKGLGIGAEMALDPMTYAGGVLGGPLGKLFGQAGGLEAAAAKVAAGEVAGLAAARRAAQEGLVNRAAQESGTAAMYADQAANLGATADVAGLAGGASKSYKMAHPGVGQALEAQGLGQGTGGGATVYGRRPPSGFEASPLRVDNRMQGKALAMGPDAGVNTPLLPDERSYLQAMGAGRAPASLQPLVPGMLDDFAAQQAALANSTRPMPSLGSAMKDQLAQSGSVPPELLGMRLPDAFAESQKRLQAALARQRAALAAYQAQQLTGADYARVAGALGAGSYAGGLYNASDRG